MFAVKLFFNNLRKKMWPKVTFFALLAILTALAAAFFKRYVPDDFSDFVGSEAVSAILGILASSMLAVTTFSLTTMVSAYSAATSSVTPRATQLLTEDRTTQNVLATFLGSFIFSLIGIICLSMGIYEGSGRFFLFCTTLAVVVLIVFTLIKWVEHLTRLGRVTETTKLVEQAGGG